MTESSACNVRPPIGRDRKDDEHVSFTDGFLAGAGYLTMVANSEPLVSVIIPCYKLAGFLAEAIESALAQSHPSIQVVVVNDGSPDHTADVCRRYKNRITYVEQTNQGRSAARNAGCRASSGAWLQFLDADDLLHPRKIEWQIADLRQQRGDWRKLVVFKS